MPAAVDESLLEINTDMHYEFSEGSSRIMGNYSQLSLNDDDKPHAPIHTSSTDKNRRLPPNRASMNWKEKSKRSSFDYTFKDEDEEDGEEQVHVRENNSLNGPDISVRLSLVN